MVGASVHGYKDVMGHEIHVVEEMFRIEKQVVTHYFYSVAAILCAFLIFLLQ